MFRRLHQSDFAALILRLSLAGIFIMHSYVKITLFDWGTSWYDVWNPHGTDEMTPALQAVVAWSELACGIALGIGLLTRLAALGMIAIMIGAISAVTYRLDFTSINFSNVSGGVIEHHVGYEYNCAIIAIALSLVILGAGAVSLDRLLFGGSSTPATPARTEATMATH
jgi:putative oxidoreductase